MRLHNAGKYNGDESSLPKREHPEGYVPFKEPQDMKKFAVLMSLLSLAIFAVMTAIYLVRLLSWISSRGDGAYDFNLVWSWAALILFFATLIPHEVLHALWFREDVYYYHNLKQGMLFVVGTEDMTKGRFVAMSLCPNVIFGFIPFMIFLIWPKLSPLGFFGVMAISAGAGDFANVFNCLTQVPRGGTVYLSGMHSYWYMPEKD